MVVRALGREPHGHGGGKRAVAADGDDDAGVRAEDVAGAVGHAPPVDPDRRVGVAVQGRAGEGDAPDREELPERERVRPRGLDVHDPAVVVRVERGDEPSGRVDPDAGGHGDRSPVDEDVQPDVDVEARVALRRQGERRDPRRQRAVPGRPRQGVGADAESGGGGAGRRDRRPAHQRRRCQEGRGGRGGNGQQRPCARMPGAPGSVAAAAGARAGR